METSLQIKIIVPLVPVYKPEEHHFEYVNNAITELLELDKKLEIEILDLGRFVISINLIENYKTISGKYRLNSSALVFQISVPNEYLRYKVESNMPSQISDEDHRMIFDSTIADRFSNFIFYFLVFSQIAKPGTIKLREGDVFVNEKIVHYFHSVSSIHRESLDDIEKIKWPKYHNIKFIDVWNWYLKYSFSYERHSKSKTERALNAFTRLFRESSVDIEFDLFWALIGIEALYCSGKEGLSEQIFNKTQVILGEITDYKKRLKQMYDFRSRLVHGDLDIPPNHFELEDDEDVNFHQNLFDSTVLAVAILTATFQTMILEDKKELHFKYISI